MHTETLRGLETWVTVWVLRQEKIVKTIQVPLLGRQDAKGKRGTKQCTDSRSQSRRVGSCVGVYQMQIQRKIFFGEPRLNRLRSFAFSPRNNILSLLSEQQRRQ